MIEKIKETLKISSVPAIIASLCCLSPVILVLTGLATTTFAASLSDLFYGTYKWVFRGVGFVALVIAYIFYIRRQGVCTFDEAIKRRNELINKFMLVLIVAILFYVIFLYGFVEYLGIKLGIWE